MKNANECVVIECGMYEETKEIYLKGTDEEMEAQFVEELENFKCKCMED